MITAEQVEKADRQAIEELDRREQARLLEEAAGFFLTYHRDFLKINAQRDVLTDPLGHCIWWDRLHALSESERALQKIFMGAQPTREQHRLYGRFRRMLLDGSRLKANA